MCTQEGLRKREREGGIERETGKENGRIWIRFAIRLLGKNHNSPEAGEQLLLNLQFDAVFYQRVTSHSL